MRYRAVITVARPPTPWIAQAAWFQRIIAPRRKFGAESSRRLQLADPVCLGFATDVHCQSHLDRAGEGSCSPATRAAHLADRRRVGSVLLFGGRGRLCRIRAG